MFGNRMQTSAIPERVYALCREVASKPMDENSLKLLLEPQNLGGKTPYFGNVRTAAEQLQLIHTKENTISNMQYPVRNLKVTATEFMYQSTH